MPACLRACLRVCVVMFFSLVHSYRWLCYAGKWKCAENAKHVLKVLTDLLGHENNQVISTSVSICPAANKCDAPRLCLCANLSPSDLAVCQRSPVQYPVYSLRETGSQRNGEITKTTSPAWRKQKLFISVFFPPQIQPVQRGGKKYLSKKEIWDWVHPVWWTSLQHR